MPIKPAIHQFRCAFGLRQWAGWLVLAIAVVVGVPKDLLGESSRPNVLFIAVDDLACSLGCYGDPIAQTPHIDALAGRGVAFKNAYCQLPLCNPSRASVLTGMRPDAIKVYDLDRHFRDEISDLVTLPQLFIQHDWSVARVGKLYHYNVPAGIGTNGLDDPASWQQVFNPKGRDTQEEHLVTNAEPHRPISAALSWLAADGEDGEQTDGMIATRAIELMEASGEQPFFLGVGFFRPHTPYVAPKSYFDLYALQDLEIPFAPDNDRDDIPKAAFAHNCPIPHYGLPLETCLQAMLGYYASVSFVDAQVGRLMAALDRLGIAQNTIVVLWSDHGYHLGEHQGVWQKRCLFEQSARAPLIVVAPEQAQEDAECRRVIEFIDIYPTVAELCGLQVPAGLPGKSLVPLLQEPSATWDGQAITQVLRPGDGEPVMGRSIRTARWRYTEWNGGQQGRELYDHSGDASEFVNLADREGYATLIERLRGQLEAAARAMPPDSPFNPKRL